jgi:hypothetical protein
VGNPEQIRTSKIYLQDKNKKIKLYKNCGAEDEECKRQGGSRTKTKNRGGGPVKNLFFVSYVCRVSGHCNVFRVMAIPIASRSER